MNQKFSLNVKNGRFFKREKRNMVAVRQAQNFHFAKSETTPQTISSP